MWAAESLTWRASVLTVLTMPARVSATWLTPTARVPSDEAVGAIGTRGTRLQRLTSPTTLGDLALEPQSRRCGRASAASRRRGGRRAPCSVRSEHLEAASAQRQHASTGRFASGCANSSMRSSPLVEHRERRAQHA
jgi:hypothetical protein